MLGSLAKYVARSVLFFNAPLLVCLMTKLAIQSYLTLGDFMGQISSRLPILHSFFEFFCALVGVTFDGIQPPCSLVAQFPFIANTCLLILGLFLLGFSFFSLCSSHPARDLHRPSRLDF